METDEPVLGSASVEKTANSFSSTRSNRNITAGSTTAPSLDDARPTDAFDEEDDEDGAASVGQAASDDEEPGPADAPAEPEAVPATSGQLQQLPSTDGVTQGGESVEAIEAAVASLALQQQSPRLRRPAAPASPPEPFPAPSGQDLTPPDASASQTSPPSSSSPNTRRSSAPGTAPPPESTTRGGPSLHAASSAAPPEGDAAPVPSTSSPSPDDEGTLWHAFPKHFFILSSAGKPIYSYNGDDKSLVGLTALISALVSVVQSQGDAVQHIRSGSTLIVFMLQGPLYFVAASSLGEPATALKKQLELLYGQLVLIVTTGLERIIQRNPSYDVRSLLDGVGGVLTALISLLSTDASYLQAAYKPLPVPAADRAAITEVLSEAVRQSGAVYGLLMADTFVVAMVRAKQQPALHPDDLLLLANFVMCNNAYRHGHGEAFSPVCLPHYNSDAFLHAYIHYLDASSGLYLVLLSGSAEAFHQLSAARVWLEDQAAARGLMPRLRSLRPPEHVAASPAAAAAATAAAGGSGGTASSAAATAAGTSSTRQQSAQQQLNVLSVENLPRPLGGRFGHTPLWSYAVRFQPLQQAVFSPPCHLHRTPAGAARLAAAYTQLHSLLHTPAAPSRPNKLAWFADPQAVLVAARDRDLELFLVCDPLTDKTTAMGLMEALKRHFGDRGILADIVLAPPA